MEHHSDLVPWQRVAREKGATLKVLPLTDEGTIDMDEFEAAMGPQTRLLAVAHMSNSLGTINPVKELAERAHAVGATVLVDGAQSVPHLPVDVEDLDCDFLAFSGHKMMGPTGIGALYAKREILDEMEPFLVGGEMVLEVWNDRATWNDLPMRFRGRHAGHSRCHHARCGHRLSERSWNGERPRARGAAHPIRPERLSGVGTGHRGFRAQRLNDPGWNNVVPLHLSCTPTIWAPFWTAWGSQSAPVTTAPCRWCVPFTRPRHGASQLPTSTTPSPRSTRWLTR